MTDRPIIFSGPMVLALLDGRKTQTLRLVTSPLAKAQPGDRLWVREAFRLRADQDHKPPSQDWWKSTASYAADGAAPTGCGGGPGKLRPSIHMPRWVSRLTLVVIAVRLERLKDIKRADVIAEGDSNCVDDPLFFPAIWDTLHKPGARWEDNPRVVVLTFTVHQQNIDRLGDA